MMCKAKEWVLALTAGLLLLLIPAQARADVTRLLILNDEQTSETSAAATDVLRRFALYSSWTCTFVSSEDVPDTDGYTAVIICTDPNGAECVGGAGDSGEQTARVCHRRGRLGGADENAGT